MANPTPTRRQVRLVILPLQHTAITALSPSVESKVALAASSFQIHTARLHHYSRECISGDYITIVRLVFAAKPFLLLMHHQLINQLSASLRSQAYNFTGRLERQQRFSVGHRMAKNQRPSNTSLKRSALLQTANIRCIQERRRNFRYPCPNLQTTGKPLVIVTEPLIRRRQIDKLQQASATDGFKTKLASEPDIKHLWHSRRFKGQPAERNLQRVEQPRPDCSPTHNHSVLDHQFDQAQQQLRGMAGSVIDVDDQHPQMTRVALRF